MTFRHLGGPGIGLEPSREATGGVGRGGLRGGRVRHPFERPVGKRLHQRFEYPLISVVTIAICAVVCGGDDFVAIAAYGRKKRQWPPQFLDLKFAAAVHGHWSIENQLHWQLDVAFLEDQSRMRLGHADTSFSILRRTALSLLRNNHTLKVGVKNQRLATGWDDSYLEQIPFGQ